MDIERRERRKKVKLNKRGKTVVAVLLLCILVPIIAYGTHLAYILYFSETPTLVTAKEQLENSNKPIGLPNAEESGVENIVLFGVDNRTPTDHGRTDSIIIATIDKNSKTLKLTSIMRDMFVKIGSTNEMNRINAAYSFGGPELALETINKNFGLDIKYYTIIDFKAFQELVDIIGGVEVEVKDYEVNEINFYIKEINGEKSTLIKKPGFQHLNGQQALSFARIRQVGNGDYERTERQRVVLKSLLEQTKKMNVVKIPQMITTLASYVQTNVPLSRILSLGATVYGFNGGTESMRLPVDGYFQGQSVHGSAVLVPDIKANAMFLKEFIYNVKVSGNKDMPAYMLNSFHVEDSTSVSSLPKPNIPDYSTPNIPTKPEEEQSNHTKYPVVIPPGTTPTTNPGEKPGTTTTTPTGGQQGGTGNSQGTEQPAAPGQKPDNNQRPGTGSKPGTVTTP